MKLKCVYEIGRGTKTYLVNMGKFRVLLKSSESVGSIFFEISSMAKENAQALQKERIHEGCS